MAAPGNPISIPWPLSSFPGLNTQESSGRLINCTAEPLGEPSHPSGPAPQVWRRQPGLSLLASTSETAIYRGGLIANNLSYEIWANAYTVSAAGVATLLGALAGTQKVSIAHNQVRPNPDVVAVDISNGAYILNTTTLASASATATIGGSNFEAGDQVSLTFNNPAGIGFPVTVTYTLGSSETATTIATGLKALINANAVLSAANFTASSAGAVLTLSQQGNVGNSTTLLAVVTPIGTSTSLTSSVTGTGNETVAIAPGSGSATATIGGSSFVNGDTVSLTFANPANPAFPIKIAYTVGVGSSAATIAAGLVALINANAILTAAGISASNASAVITILQPIGNETVTFNHNPLSGGAGNPGIVFSGAPLAYNGLGGLPQPNSVSFQDGYFFYTIADGRVFASPLNSVGAINSQTFVTIQSKSDVTLFRGIAYAGVMWFFTTGGCEIWQDAAGVAPAFPYSRQLVIEYGLVQPNAIAGWETGFSILMWVAQDFGVYMALPGSYAPTKVSPPDLDRLIQAQVKAGNNLEASCYAFAGKKFWVLSSPSWTWEFNCSTQKWNERWSLSPLTGSFGRWRGTGGHPAFNQWIMGDEYSGNLLYVDPGNHTEHGAVLLFRMESGPVEEFPDQTRIARADFQFDMGVGQAVANVLANITGAVADGGGQIKLTVSDTAQMRTNDTGVVSGVTGTTEANGTWPITIVDATHVLLQGSVFKNAYVSGGTLIDVTSPPNAINPSAAISLSKDGGNRWGNPLIRYLGTQARTQRPRASVKSMGLSGPMGCRWRIDISDPVELGFLKASQSSDPREVGV
jgi:hypothetical protein